MKIKDLIDAAAACKVGGFVCSHEEDTHQVFFRSDCLLSSC
jgi:hypothetical protein